jgi:hypothetical protein
MNIPSFFQPPDVLTGQYRAAGRGATRCVTVGIGEEDSFARHAVKSWCLDHGITHCPGVAPGLIIGNAEQYVWPLLGSRDSGKGRP